MVATMLNPLTHIAAARCLMTMTCYS